MFGVRGLTVIAKNSRLSENSATQNARSLLARCLARGKNIGSLISRPVSSDFDCPVGSNISATGNISVGVGGIGSVTLGGRMVSIGSVIRSSGLAAPKFRVIVPVAEKTSHNASSPLKFREFEALRTSANKPHPHLQQLISIDCESIVTRLAVTDLHSYLKQGAMPLGETLKLVRQAGEGLEHLHKLGFLHLDVKPANVLINTAGDAILSDLGGNTRKTIAESGYAGFGFPEASADINEHTDIFGLATMMFELCTGRPLAVSNRGMSGQEFLQRFDKETLNSQLNYALGCDTGIADSQVEAFITTVLQALDTDPGKRPSLSELVNAIKILECRVGGERVYTRPPVELSGNGLPPIPSPDYLQTPSPDYNTVKKVTFANPLATYRLITPQSTPLTPDPAP